MANGYLVLTDGNILKHQQPAMSEVGELIGARTGLFDVVYGEVNGKVFLIWVDDTGLIDGRPVNPFATLVAGRPLFGDVFITGDENDEGEVVDLDFESFDEWLGARLFEALTGEEDESLVETTNILSDDDAMAAIREGEADVARGDLTDVE